MYDSTGEDDTEAIAIHPERHKVPSWLAGALVSNATHEPAPQGIDAEDWDRFVGDISSALPSNAARQIVGPERARGMLNELDDLIFKLRTSGLVPEPTVQKIAALRRAVAGASGNPISGSSGHHPIERRRPLASATR